MVRVRIAPSPTGFFHIGTARTALFNWLFAKKNKGEFILRIEDTDLERSDKKYEEDILSGLKWLGLAWDGPIFRQSERLSIYRKYIEKLLGEDKAFWCYHTKEELELEQKEQMKNKEAPRHICEYKYKKQAPKGGKGIIRLAVDEHSQRVIHFNDAIRGVIEFEQRVIGDLSIAKDLDTPLYNFAVVADDYEMEISHVIRGEDHIPNTPKQILISEALGFKLPVYAHLPLILGSDKSKLSKRHGATSLAEYKKDYLPEALVNFMGFLGFTYDKEILSAKEMAGEFELGKIHKSGAIFNVEKLNWINSQYAKKLTADELKKITGFNEIPEKAVPLITERLEKLSDVKNFDFFWEEPKYDHKLLVWKGGNTDDTKKALKLIKEKLEKINWEDFDGEKIKRELDDLAKTEFAGDRGVVYWPLRVALSGKEFSPDPVQIMRVLTKKQVVVRIEKIVV